MQYHRFRLFNIGYKLYIHRYSTYDYFDLRLVLGHFCGPKYIRISGDTCILFLEIFVSSTDQNVEKKENVEKFKMLQIFYF